MNNIERTGQAPHPKQQRIHHVCMEGESVGQTASGNPACRSSIVGVGKWHLPEKGVEWGTFPCIRHYSDWFCVLFITNPISLVSFMPSSVTGAKIVANGGEGAQGLILIYLDGRECQQTRYSDK